MHISIFGLVLFVLKLLHEKFAILSIKPRSLVTI